MQSNAKTLSVGQTSPKARIFVGYEGTFRSDLSSHGVNGGIRQLLIV